MSALPPLIIHGVPSSQPARAVFWTCLIKGLPIEIRFPMDHTYLQGEEFGKINPTRKIPVIIFDPNRIPWSDT